MAIIRKIKETSRSYSMKKGLTYCDAEYNSYIYNDEKFVRLQTFGSNERQDKGKQSQVIHISKESAETLIALLKKLLSYKFKIRNNLLIIY